MERSSSLYIEPSNYEFVTKPGVYSFVEMVTDRPNILIVDDDYFNLYSLKELIS
jgi:hypothetical protein